MPSENAVALAQNDRWAHECQFGVQIEYVWNLRTISAAWSKFMRRAKIVVVDKGAPK